MEAGDRGVRSWRQIRLTVGVWIEGNEPSDGGCGGYVGKAAIRRSRLRRRGGAELEFASSTAIWRRIFCRGGRSIKCWPVWQRESTRARYACRLAIWAAREWENRR